MSSVGKTEVHVAPLREVDPATLYAILQLRVEVFVVEQNCPYRELDGRDVEPGALLIWATGVDDDPQAVVGTLRVLSDPGGRARIGRVATAIAHRGAGLAAALMRAAIAQAGDRVIVLDAQAHLETWYGRFGFVRCGEEYLEDGIPHVPMERAGANRRQGNAGKGTPPRGRG